MSTDGPFFAPGETMCTVASAPAAPSPAPAALSNQSLVRGAAGQGTRWPALPGETGTGFGQNLRFQEMPAAAPRAAEAVEVGGQQLGRGRVITRTSATVARDAAALTGEAIGEGEVLVGGRAVGAGRVVPLATVTEAAEAAGARAAGRAVATRAVLGAVPYVNLALVVLQIGEVLYCLVPALVPLPSANAAGSPVVPPNSSLPTDPAQDPGAFPAAVDPLTYTPAEDPVSRPPMRDPAEPGHAPAADPRNADDPEVLLASDGRTAASLVGAVRQLVESATGSSVLARYLAQLIDENRMMPLQEATVEALLGRGAWLRHQHQHSVYVHSSRLLFVHPRLRPGSAAEAAFAAITETAGRDLAGSLDLGRGFDQRFFVEVLQLDLPPALRRTGTSLASPQPGTAEADAAHTAIVAKIDGSYGRRSRFRREELRREIREKTGKEPEELRSLPPGPAPKDPVESLGDNYTEQEWEAAMAELEALEKLEFEDGLAREWLHAEREVDMWRPPEGFAPVEQAARIREALRGYLGM